MPFLNCFGKKMKKKSNQKIREMNTDMDKLHLPVHTTTEEDDMLENVAVSDHGSLGVFPEEVWEAILNRVSCSEDIQNVFLAFPELGRSFHNKKGNWLFGLVLPYLISEHLTVKMLKDLGVVQKWTQSKELMNLRLVSKRWKNYVDMVLQTEVNHCPCPSSPSAGQNINLNENHFNFMPMSDFHTGMTIFHNADQVDKFMEDMANHQGNPFPSKSIWIRPENALARNSEQLTEKCVGLFEKFGKHVDVLDIGFYDRESRCHFNICNNVLKCLFNLPNLRSLIFKGEFEGQRGDDIRTDVKTSKHFGQTGSQKLFPKFGKLESFNWQVLLTNSAKESEWTVGMIKAYGKGENLWKLGIDEKLYWSYAKASSLVNLTELSLFLNESFEPNIGKIEKTLRSLPFGQKLRKMGLKQLKPCQSEIKVNLYELINMLSGFQIETLAIEDLHLEETKDFEGKPETKICAKAASITSIVVEDNLELSYEFLGLLPNLRFLTVHESNEVRADASIMFEDKNFDGDKLANKLRKAILQPSTSGLAVIWEMLPKLEMISGSVDVFLPFGVPPQGFNLDVQYVRECENKYFIGNMPDFDEMGELLFVHHHHDQDDDDDEDDDEDDDDYEDDDDEDNEDEYFWH